MDKEECRENLRMVLENWMAISLKLGTPIPPIEGY